MRSSSITPTLKLASARLEFHNDRRLTQALHLVAVAALIFLFLMIGRRLYVDSQASRAELAELKQQNAALRADHSRALVELELERSTDARPGRASGILQPAKWPPGPGALILLVRPYP
jgi:hypothetical protein